MDCDRTALFSQPRKVFCYLGQLVATNPYDCGRTRVRRSTPPPHPRPHSSFIKELPPSVQGEREPGRQGGQRATDSGRTRLRRRSSRGSQEPPSYPHPRHFRGLRPSYPDPVGISLLYRNVRTGRFPIFLAGEHRVKKKKGNNDGFAVAFFPFLRIHWRGVGCLGNRVHPGSRAGWPATRAVSCVLSGEGRGSMQKLRVS